MRARDRFARFAARSNGHTSAMAHSKDLKDVRVAVLATEGFEQAELVEPVK